MTDDFRDQVLDQAVSGVGVLDEIRRAEQRQADAIERLAAATEGTAQRQVQVKGDKGDKGEKGEKGDTVVGPVGPAGKNGADGESVTGPAGPPGRDGGIGPRGGTGPRGLTGDDGGAGEPGADGRTILNGEGPPDLRQGEPGDFYLDTKVPAIYGPRTTNSWGSPTRLIGPPGPPGMSTGGGGAAVIVTDDGADPRRVDIIDIVAPLTISWTGRTAHISGPAGGGAALSDDTPLVENGAGDPGVGTEGSRSDHVHPAGGAAATPTLAEVLVQGNDPDGTEIKAADDGDATGASAEWEAADGTEGGDWQAQSGDGDTGGGGASLNLHGGDGGQGGELQFSAGDGAAGGDGGELNLNGGSADGGANVGARLVLGAAVVGTDGLAGLTTGGSQGPGPLVSDGTTLTYSIAAFVPNPATPQQIRDALVAAGLMAAS